MSGKEINNNEKFAAAYEQLPQDVKDRLSFKNTESREDWQKRRSDAKHMATPWFNQGVTIMGPAGYFVAETQINREHARVDTYLALANADFIVKCVNSHYALIAIAKRYASECLNCGGHGFVYEGDAVTGRGPDDVFPNEVACDECADIRAAIDAALSTRDAAGG